MLNVAGRSWDAISSLILIRYAVERLGDGAFGVWVLVGALTGYVALLDFGLTSAYVKFNAQHWARDEVDELSSVLSTGTAFYFAAGSVLVALCWPLAPVAVGWLERFHMLGGIDPAEAAFILRGSVALFAATSAMAGFAAVLSGLQRMGVTNALAFGASIVKLAAAVAFIEWGFGLRGLLFAHGAAFAVFSLGCAIAAFSIVPGLRLSIARVRRATFRKLFGFGFRTQVARFSNLVMFETDQIVAGVIGGSAGSVALYSFGVSMANKLRQIPALLVSALLPAAADLDARADAERLKELYLRASKYLALAAVPMTAVAIGCAGPLMRTWLGDRPGLDTSIWVLRILGVGYLANVMAGAGMSVALGRGRADVQMRAGLIATGANILLTVLLVLWIGFWGIPIATTVSMFLSSAWFFRRMRSIAGVGPVALLRATMVCPAAAAMPGLAFALWCDWATADAAGVIPHAVALAASVSFLAITYVGLIRFLPFFDAYDVEFMEDHLALRRVPGFRLWSARARRV
jgi:O-antigen/teichoic acid export membrane protein